MKASLKKPAAKNAKLVPRSKTWLNGNTSIIKTPKQLNRGTGDCVPFYVLNGIFALEPLILQGSKLHHNRIENPRVGGSIPSRATSLTIRRVVAFGPEGLQIKASSVMRVFVAFTLGIFHSDVFA